MSCVDVLDACRDSPLRARSFCTVRAAISLARFSERPCRRSPCLTCSYWRARFVPFLTPRGGTFSSFRSPTWPVPGSASEQSGSAGSNRLGSTLPVSTVVLDDSRTGGHAGHVLGAPGARCPSLCRVGRRREARGALRVADLPG